jgi:hypothetical protein
MKSRFGKSQLTDLQRREARAIVVAARAEHGTTTEAAKAIGIALGTFSGINSGIAQAGSAAYAQLKEYERKKNESKAG